MFRHKLAVRFIAFFLLSIQSVRAEDNTVDSITSLRLALLRTYGKLKPGYRYTILRDNVNACSIHPWVDTLNRGDAIMLIDVRGSQALVAYGKPGWVNCADLAKDDDAIETFSKQIQENPGDAGAFAARALVLDASDKSQQALPDANAALRLAPNNIRFLVSRARILGHLTNCADSVADTERAMKLDPTDTTALRSRSGNLSYKGKPVEALDALNRAIEIDSTDPDSYMLRAMIRFQLHGEQDRTRGVTTLNMDDPSEIQESMTDLNRALALNPYFPSALQLRAIVFLNTHRYRECIDDCNRCIDFSGEDAQTLSIRGGAYWASGHPLDAASDFECATQLGESPNEVSEVHCPGSAPFSFPLR